jgi:hypothetical protein
MFQAPPSDLFHDEEETGTRLWEDTQTTPARQFHLTRKSGNLAKQEGHVRRAGRTP